MVEFCMKARGEVGKIRQWCTSQHPIQLFSAITLNQQDFTAGYIVHPSILIPGMLNPVIFPGLPSPLFSPWRTWPINAPSFDAFHLPKLSGDFWCVFSYVTAFHLKFHAGATHLWLYFFLMPRPYFESIDPFETGKDSRLAINRFIDDPSSSVYSDSISLSTNFGISFRFFSISVTRCFRPSSSRRIAAACSSAESSWMGKKRLNESSSGQAENSLTIDSSQVREFQEWTWLEIMKAFINTRTKLMEKSIKSSAVDTSWID